jgi:hypothetical protein
VSENPSPEPAAQPSFFARHPALSLVAFNALIFLFVIGLAEVVLRVVITYQPGYYVSVSGTSTELEFPYGTILINSDGFPDSEFDLSKDVKIGYYGDSVTYGVGAGYGYRVSDLLEKHYIANAAKLFPVALNKLERIASLHKCIVKPRGRGLMLAVDVVENRRSRTPDPQLRDRIVREAFSRGLLLLGCGENGIRVSPPLCINHVQLEVGLDVFDEVVATVAI